MRHGPQWAEPNQIQPGSMGCSSIRALTQNSRSSVHLRVAACVSRNANRIIACFGDIMPARTHRTDVCCWRSVACFVEPIPPTQAPSVYYIYFDFWRPENCVVFRYCIFGGNRRHPSDTRCSSIYYFSAENPIWSLLFHWFTHAASASEAVSRFLECGNAVHSFYINENYNLMLSKQILMDFNSSSFVGFPRNETGFLCYSNCQSEKNSWWCFRCDEIEMDVLVRMEWRIEGGKRPTKQHQRKAVRDQEIKG